MPNHDTLKSFPTNRAIRLLNINCPYCGALLTRDLPGTKEHVIGRRFVPRGTFDRQWNLIVQACEPCNRKKANLEDDISAITMLPDMFGRYAVDDPRLIAEAKRKAANARSRRTRKPVGDSYEQLKLNHSTGTSTIMFDVVGPPQIDERRIFELAWLHASAFFFLITYNQETRRGGFFLGKYRPLTYVRRRDWGNPQMRWFMNFVRNWEFRLLAIGADGFFKIMIRKQPSGDNVWAIAVEWNQDMRVVGFVGDDTTIDGFARDIPSDIQKRHLIGPNHWVAVRTEEELAPQDDCLFVESAAHG